MQEDKKRKKEASLYSVREKLIILMALLSFGSFSFFYFSDISLRGMFSTQEERKLLQPVGKLVSKTGTGLRQRALDFQFRSMGAGEPLYANDTLMTGDDGTMIIELKGGQTFEVKPSSLVKLSIETELAMRGLVRLEVLQGRGAEADSVENNAQQLTISNAIPNPDSAIVFGNDEALEKSKPITFKFKTNKRNWSLKITLFKLSEGTAPPTKTKLREIEADTSQFFVTEEISIAEPGNYEWTVQDRSGHVWQTQQFEAMPPQSQNE